MKQLVDAFKIIHTISHSNKLIKHGKEIVEVERTFDGIKKYLSEHEIEGLVFWKDGIPQCKIKRSDFGFEWPVRMGGCTE